MAHKHYLTLTDEDFDAAVESKIEDWLGMQPPAEGRTEAQKKTRVVTEVPENASFADLVDILETDKVTVTMGGVDFTYTQRRSYDRCSYMCSGQTGLHASETWSAWSPARFPIPTNNEDLLPVREKAFEPLSERPELPDGGMQSPITYSKTQRDVILTCGNCMHVCQPDPEECKRRTDLLHNVFFRPTLVEVDHLGRRF